MAEARSAGTPADRERALDDAVNAAYAWRAQGGTDDGFDRVRAQLVDSGADKTYVNVVQRRADQVVASGASDFIRPLNNAGDNFGAPLQELQRAIDNDPDHAYAFISRSVNYLQSTGVSPVAGLEDAAFRELMSQMGYGKEVQEATIAYAQRSEQQRADERGAFSRMTFSERLSYLAGKALDSGMFIGAGSIPPGHSPTSQPLSTPVMGAARQTARGPLADASQAVRAKSARSEPSPTPPAQPPGPATGETTNAFSNIGVGYSANNATALRDFPPGSGFSGVFNPGTGQFLAYPSGDTRLADGSVPANIVRQYGGHGQVNAVFSRLLRVDPTTNLGFVMTLESDGTISMRFRSRSVNLANPSFQGDVVPRAQQEQIKRAIEAATGRTAR
jgi:hypothetical protein